MHWLMCHVWRREATSGRCGKRLAGLAIALAAAILGFPAAADTFGGRLVVAATATTKKPPPGREDTSASAFAARAKGPVVTVTQPGPGQEGFVHYFVITGPDGEPESHVGIELPDSRIAWSFPELGVTISPFTPTGAILANGKEYAIEHLYGIRPFPDDASMRALQKDLIARVASFVDQKTPYCDEQGNTARFCVSCLGFAMRILFPGPSLYLPSIPRDFKSARKNIYTTEDLLFYLTGVQVDAPRAAQLKHIESLSVPQDMREELVRIATETETTQPVVTITAAKPPPTATPRAGTRRTVDLPKRVLSKRRS
jgi:hypothetical protein